VLCREEGAAQTSDNETEITIEMCRAYRANFVNQLLSMERQVNTQIISLKDATTLAKFEMDKRLEGMNEFRNQLKDQSSMFYTKSEHEQFGKRIEDDIRSLRESRASLEGKASQNSVLIAYGLPKSASCAAHEKRRSMNYSDQNNPVNVQAKDLLNKKETEETSFREFSEEDPKTDKTLKAYIRDNEQCHEAIFVWAIEGLKRLLDNKGRFTFTKSMEETRKQYERSTNPTVAFVEDNCHQDQEKHIEKDHMYRCLKKYCE
jgi:hypothetical protein